MSVPFDELKYLEAIERLGNAAAAARELSVAPSTVYRRIGALEKDLGVVCLSRGGGITHAGREIAAVARSARASLTETVRRLRAAGTEVDGVVSITTVTGFVPLLSDALAKLARTHPALSIELHIADDGPSVRDREVDVAISVVSKPPPTLVGRRVLTIRYAVYGIDVLATDPMARWIVLGPPMHTTAQARWESEHVPSSRVALATGSRFAFLELVRAGMGVGVLPRPPAARYPELRLVETNEAALAELDRPAWLLTHPDLRSSAKVTAVVDALAAALA